MDNFDDGPSHGIIHMLFQNQPVTDTSNTTTLRQKPIFPHLAAEY